MKKKTVYWLPKLGILAVLSMMFMLASAIVRIAWACGEEQLSRPVFWFQVVLPLVANFSFLPIVLRDGKDRFFRTAVPVWLGCVFFGIKSFGFTSVLHTGLCLCLYLLVLVLYTATVTGHVPTQVPLWFLFGLPLLYHIFVEDMQLYVFADPPVPFLEWLPEISVLCIMASLLALSFGIRKRDQ